MSYSSDRCVSLRFSFDDACSRVVHVEGVLCFSKKEKCNQGYIGTCGTLDCFRQVTYK